MRNTPIGLFPFRGFKRPAQEDFTQVPNEFFDLIPVLDDRELRVLLVMMRHTFGWHRVSASPSLADLNKQTGMNDRQVLRGLLGTGKTALLGEGCVPKGLVTKETTTRRGLKGMKGRNRYSVHIRDTVEMAVSKTTASLEVTDTASHDTASLDVSQVAVSTNKERTVNITTSSPSGREKSLDIPPPDAEVEPEEWQAWPLKKRSKWGCQFMKDIMAVYWDGYEAFYHEKSRANGSALAGVIAKRLETCSPYEIKAVFRQAFLSRDPFIADVRESPRALLGETVFAKLWREAESAGD